MKYFLLAALAVATASLVTYKVTYHKTKHANFVADRYSAEYGCLVGTQFGCYKIEDDLKRGECFDHSILFCGKVAVAFENFLRQGYK